MSGGSKKGNSKGVGWPFYLIMGGLVALGLGERIWANFSNSSGKKELLAGSIIHLSIADPSLRPSGDLDNSLNRENLIKLTDHWGGGQASWRYNKALRFMNDNDFVLEPADKNELIVSNDLKRLRLDIPYDADKEFFINMAQNILDWVEAIKNDCEEEGYDKIRLGRYTLSENAGVTFFPEGTLDETQALPADTVQFDPTFLNDAPGGMQ